MPNLLIKLLAPAAALTVGAATHAAGPADGSVSLFLGSPGQPGDVVLVDEAGSSTPVPVAGLQDIRLLPIDFPGRTELETFLADRPRRFADQPGAARLRLPGNAGSLYAFARPSGGGAADHGYFLVDADGAARLLLERPGVGVLGADSPFLPFAAAAPDGSAILVGTLPAAGGDALEIELATGLVTDRTALLAPLDFAPRGLHLGASWGALAAANGLLRFDRAPGASAAAVAVTGTPAWFGGEFAVSPDGATLAFAAGDGPQAARVHLLHATGTAAAVQGAPLQSLSGAGFLPEAPDGPYLGFSADGAVCTWRTEGLSREAWTARIAPVGPPPPAFQVTSDALFLDTLDEVGLVGSVVLDGGALVIAVGERADPIQGGLENLDFYRVTPPAGAGAPTLENLSLSSGDAVAPFLAPSQIDVDDGVYRVPGLDALLLHDQEGGNGALVWLDLVQGGATTLLNNVKSLDEVERVGADFLLSVRREGPADTRQLVRVTTAGTPTASVLLQLPKEIALGRFAARDDGWCGFTVTNAVGSAGWIARAHVPSGGLELLTTLVVEPGPAASFTPGGRLALSVGPVGGAPFFGAWGFGVVGAVYWLPPQPGWVLPGS